MPLWLCNHREVTMGFFVFLGLTLIVGYFTSAHFVGMLFKWSGSICLGLMILLIVKDHYDEALIFFIVTIALWTIGGKITDAYPKRGSEEELTKF